MDTSEYIIEELLKIIDEKSKEEKQLKEEERLPIIVVVM